MKKSVLTVFKKPCVTKKIFRYLEPCLIFKATRNLVQQSILRSEASTASLLSEILQIGVRKVSEKLQKAQEEFESLERQLNLERLNETNLNKELLQLQDKIEEYQTALSQLQAKVAETKINFEKIKKNRKILEKSYSKAEQKLQSLKGKKVPKSAKIPASIVEDSFFNVIEKHIDEKKEIQKGEQKNLAEQLGFISHKAVSTPSFMQDEEPTNQKQESQPEEKKPAPSFLFTQPHNPSQSQQPSKTAPSFLQSQSYKEKAPIQPNEGLQPIMPTQPVHPADRVIPPPKPITPPPSHLVSDSQVNKSAQESSTSTQDSNFDPGLDSGLGFFTDKNLTKKGESEKTSSKSALEFGQQESGGITAPPVKQFSTKPKKPEVLCIICYSSIDKPPKHVKDFDESNYSIDKDVIKCPNDHYAHREGIKQWLLQNNTCPVCHMEYPPEVLASFDQFKLEEEQRKREAAEKEKLKLTKKDTLDPEYVKQYTLARENFSQQNYDQTIEILWKMVDQKFYGDNHPNTLRILFQISLTYYQMQKFPLAMKQLMKIVRIDFNYPLGFYFLGKSYQAMNMPDKAQWAFERSIGNLSEMKKKNPRFNKYYDEVFNIISTNNPN